MADKNFNPNNPGAADSNLFGLHYNGKESVFVILPVCLQATVSYGSVTANGPEAVL